MTPDEMIAVIQAHKEGKWIEYKCKEGNHWVSMVLPIWNFEELDYRVKPEPHYRPFLNAEEVTNAIKEHGGWIIEDKKFHHITSISENRIEYGTGWKDDFETMLDVCTFADGTPFGVKEG